ncbi:phosphotransferase [Mesobacillus sp. S13]|uniref:phosphotransferase n=1 Tax=Mesobacillus sp. S13 TaxID=2880221 RepID=UPI001CF4B19B|nr:phosphotransferase [Mesobacillus sp. S13]
MYNFYILETISKFPDLSQKAIAEKCNISAGKVNYTINKLLANGLLDINKNGKKFQYTVTESGKEYLKQELEEFQSTKVTLHTSGKKRIKNAVILAAGAKNDFQEPVCLVPIDEITLINRTLDILSRNGIEKIVIVTGYKAWAFDAHPSIANRPGIHFVHNADYLWTGSMASLAAAREFLNDDFILIEDDILIEENAIIELLDQKERDCILVTKESGSGDEAYIEIRNGYLYKISKDIHQMNRIDGEMIGVTKVSIDVYREMLRQFEFNKNPFMNYEYMLLDISRKINIGFLKISDMIWAEVDNTAQLQAVIDKTYPMLIRKEALFKEYELRQTIASALDIDENIITEVKPFGGMTNKNFKATIGDEDYVVRVSGAGTQDMINRIEEKKNTELVAALGINPEQLYFDETTGLKIARFITDAETLNPKTAKRPENIRKVAMTLKKLHSSGIEMINEFDTFKTLAVYELLTDKAGGTYFEDYEEVKDQVIELKNYYEKMHVQPAPCHNDTVPENFVRSTNDTLYLIDWEYSGMNDPLWDLAAFSLECGFDEKEEELFLKQYFDGTPTIQERERIIISKIFQDFLWSVWTLLKEACGDDFGPYGLNRYNRAKENIQLFKQKFGEAAKIEQ